MKTLELNGLQELSQSDLVDVNGGEGIKDLFKKIITIKAEGFLDGIDGNENVDLYLLGFKIF